MNLQVKKISGYSSSSAEMRRDELKLEEWDRAHLKKLTNIETGLEVYLHWTGSVCECVYMQQELLECTGLDWKCVRVCVHATGITGLDWSGVRECVCVCVCNSTFTNRSSCYWLAWSRSWQVERT